MTGRSCPSCHRSNATCTMAEGQDDPSPPRAGDFSICLFCAEIAVFDDHNVLRFPTPEEIHLLEEHGQEVLRGQARLRELLRRRQPKPSEN